MNSYLLTILLILAAYLLGSVATAVWVGKLFFGIDVREHGSGNAGATNTMRVLGVKAGIPVIIVDILKGWLAVQLVHLNNLYAPASDGWYSLELILGGAAVLGHVYPVFAGFRGGKGVATLFGVVLAVHALATLGAVGVFLITLFASHYVSLSSILAGCSFPLFTMLVPGTRSTAEIIFSIAVALLLIYTHRQNIRRLAHGEESKATFLFGDKNKKQQS
ncbi:MAG: glycerol-3-phosphate 1-O-acyltransferase PlsY [Bacteroidales bacterium]